MTEISGMKGARLFALHDGFKLVFGDDVGETIHISQNMLARTRWDGKANSYKVCGEGIYAAQEVVPNYSDVLVGNWNSGFVDAATELREAYERRDIRARIADGDYELTAYQTQGTAGNKREARAERRRRFQWRLEAENGIPHEVAFAGIFTKAWEDGHDQGLLHVVECYEALCTMIVNPIVTYVGRKSL